MNSPFGHQPSREEKEIKVLKERVERLEYMLTELVTLLYKQEGRIEGGIYLNAHPFGEIMSLVKTLKK